MRWWRHEAAAIPDPALRQIALDAQRAKLGNIEGAVAFAAFAQPSTRVAAMRAMACYEAMLDYLDCLCEMPTSDAIANGRQLNQALVAAVEPGTRHVDYYAFHSHYADNGYLRKLVETCRAAFNLLPSGEVVGEAVRRASIRIARYQSLNHGDVSGSHMPFEQWARQETHIYRRAHSGKIKWWELGASAGSSLIVFALMGAAANPEIESTEANAIEAAYFPWIGAVNSLLDSLVDELEDSAPGQHRLLDYYGSRDEVAGRLAFLVRESASQAGQLGERQLHLLILAAMIGFYLSTPQARKPELRSARESIQTAASGLSRPVSLVMETRSTVGQITSTGKANTCTAT